jgi:hypothetical protein
MRDQRLFNYYPQLTPSERLRLAVQAAGRGDEPELKRLMDSCPRVQPALADHPMDVDHLVVEDRAAAHPRGQFERCGEVRAK